MTSLPAFPHRSGAPVRDKVQAAVIGAGAWAPLHVEAIRRTGIGEVAVLVGRDPARVRVAAARLAVERASVNAKDVLEDPMIDVIHICTPNDSHAPLAHAAIAAGKHVVVEKPIALSAGEARGLAEAAGAARVHGMTAFTYRGSSTLRRFRKRVQAGELGEIRIAAGHYLQDWLSRPSANWRLDPIQGGPSLTVADIGVHWFDAVEFASSQRLEQVVANLAITRASVWSRSSPTSPSPEWTRPGAKTPPVCSCGLITAPGGRCSCLKPSRASKTRCGLTSRATGAASYGSLERRVKTAPSTP